MSYNESMDIAPQGATYESFPRIETGNRQADQILGGGFPANSINVVMGQPGTGKTIFAEQLLYHNAGSERPVIYVTTLSESMSKVVSYVQRFDFFDDRLLGSSIQYDDISRLLTTNGPAALVPWLADVIKTRLPRIIIIDSFRAIHDLATSPSEMRRLIAELGGLLGAFEVTTFLLGEYTSGDIDRFPEFALADGIIELARQPLTKRDERLFRVLKLRGSAYKEGQHAFRITASGIELYPRLVTPRVPEGYSPRLERIKTGVPGLDDMLDGGLWLGSATLLVGPTGSGKTTLGLQFALEGIREAQASLYVNFQENPAQLGRSINGLGMTPQEARSRGLHLMYVSPVELQIDSIIGEVFELVRSGAIQRVVIDAVGDLAAAAYDPQRLHDYIYSFVQHLAVNGITSVLTFESGDAYTGTAQHEARFSYMSDNVIVIGLGGEHKIKRTIRVVKTRNSAHDHRVRTLEIGEKGGRVL
jgi:circadian clock protein KaiC